MNIAKFSWAEAFNNSKGKTAMPLICGFVMIVTGCIGTLYSLFVKYGEGLAASSALVVSGGTLLGIRRFSPDKDVPPTAEPSNP